MLGDIIDKGIDDIIETDEIRGFANFGTLFCREILTHIVIVSYYIVKQFQRCCCAS